MSESTRRPPTYRWMDTWETTHAGVPPLQDKDAVFQPLRREEGRWYGGGRTYTLDQLVDHQALAYTYDARYRV